MKNILIEAFKKQIEKTTDFKQIEIHDPLKGFFNMSKTFSTITLKTDNGDRFTVSQVFPLGAEISFSNTTEQISAAEFDDLHSVAKAKLDKLQCTETNTDYAKLQNIINGTGK